MAKEEALKKISDMEMVEYLLFSSGVITATYHVILCNMLQYLHRAASNSPLSEFEGES